MKAAESDARDISVIPTDALDPLSAALFSKPWLTQTADGGIVQHDSEEDACRAQRVYRLTHGLNPFSGEPIDLAAFIDRARHLLRPEPSILDLPPEGWRARTITGEQWGVFMVACALTFLILGALTIVAGY